MKTNLSVSPRRLGRGFTLIELMIVVAIIGILARIAYPAYTSYVRRGDMAEAFQNLASLQVKAEQYYQDNRSYASSGTTCGVTMPTSPAVTYFTYTCSAPTATTYIITATGATGKPTAGYAYTINQGGSKGTTAFNGATVNLTDCWAKKSTGDC
jgi:type IV pilus assembly protein PilE